MAQINNQSLTEIRQDLHEYAESGWKEFRTTALIAEELDEREFSLHLGANAVDPDARLGVPDRAEIDAAVERAQEEEAPEEYLDAMDGITGLVAVKKYNDGSGPTIGVRVDMDALERDEAGDEDHRPAREGFASQHPNEMHACGHDGHTAIGLGIARELDTNKGFNGTLKLFFQPAEEGGRGGYPMSQTPLLADVDKLLALHLGLGEETGTIIANYERPLANTKIDVVFGGEPAHAGSAPQEGRNALQALATAIQNLYAIPRHADGRTRINVGAVSSDNAQNVIAEEARMRVEVRGETEKLNEYVLERAERAIEHAAGMHDVEYHTIPFGKTTSFTADDELVDHVVTATETIDEVDAVQQSKQFGGSEDASYLIRRVQEEGGKATYVGIGASNPYGHHTAKFDIDEDALSIGVNLLSETIRSL